MNSLDIDQQFIKEFEIHCEEHFYDLTLKEVGIQYEEGNIKYFSYIDTFNNEEVRIMYNYRTTEEIKEEIKFNFLSLFDNRFIKKLVKNHCSKYNKIKIEKEIKTESCCICFEDYTNNKTVYHCGHSVCGCCSEKIKVCPYCRRNTQKDLYDIIRLIIKNYNDDEETLEEELNKVFDFDNFVKNHLTIVDLECIGDGNQGLFNNVFGQQEEKTTTDEGTFFIQVLKGKLEQH